MKARERLERYVPVVQLFAARAMLFHQAIAGRLGLTATEFKCFRLIERLGPLSLTELAGEAGLKAGTASGLVDRLETENFIERTRDPADRRRLVIKALPAAAARADAFYADQAAEMTTLLSDYSDQEFELMIDMLGRITDALTRSQRRVVADRTEER